MNISRLGLRVIPAVFFVLSCSQADRAPVAGPSARMQTTYDAPSVGGGVVTGSAAGDVKTGSGALDLDRLRMDRQLPAGVSVTRQYALPGQTYRAEVGETIELWAEYSGASNPRLIIDWGAGEPNSPDFSGCGSCLLTHRYANPGRYTVVVKLDDRVSTTITRTFFLDSTPPAPVGTQITVFGEAYGHHGACSGFNGCGNAATCALWACEVKGFTTLVSFGADKPCTQFNVCHLFHSRGDVQYNWGNWCPVQGVTDIVCR